MKAVVFEKFGEPHEVLAVRDVPALPEPQAGQVRVRMLMVPVNPSDMMTVRGQYGRRPELPATPGYEGVGVIDAAGPGLLAWLRGLRPGRRVAVLNSHGGNWQEFVNLPARQAVPVPADIPDEQVASFFVNPATAFIMTRWLLRVPAGEWLLQTAAASALGRMVIRLGQHFGFRTINVVRRRAQAEELRQAGADAVISTDEEDVDKRVSELTQGAGVRYALDAVGGAMGLGAIRALGAGGRLLVYGTLANEPVSLDTRLLMVGAKRVEGFWLSEWVRGQGVLTMLKLFRNVIRLLRANVLTTKVESVLDLHEVAQAVQKAETPGRLGKVLLRIANR
jgi:NADPH:quinone reductase-like Zn-dependent oxidoreductase